MATIRELASQMDDAFTVCKRDSGEQYFTLKDDAPEWMKDVCRAAHDDGDIMPDDFRYEFIAEAVEIIATRNDFDDAVYEMEPDVYNNELLKWVGSSLSRASYVDDAAEEYGPAASLFEGLARGQLAEKHEVFHQVLEALRELEEDAEDEPDDDEPYFGPESPDPE